MAIALFIRRNQALVNHQKSRVLARWNALSLPVSLPAGPGNETRLRIVCHRRRVRLTTAPKSITNSPWAINSGVECYLHTVEVTGSNPVSPIPLLSTTCTIPFPGKTAIMPKIVPIF